MTNKIKKEIAKGFTLIETLVAVLILASAIAGPLTIASKGLSAANLAKSQTTAQFLAQDALEYVRYVRDSNRLAGSAWLMGLDGDNGCTGANGCYFDSLGFEPSAVTACGGSGCPAIRYNSSTGSYRDDGDTGLSFTRTVTITPIAGTSDEVVVNVVVSWRDNVNTANLHQVTIVENMFNWQ